MHSIKHLIEIALNEDIGSGDITTESIVAPELTGTGVIIAKEPLIVAGIDIARQVFQLLDAAITFNSACNDGDALTEGSMVAQVQGKLRALLIGERTALNFLQRLSGIATCVR